MNSVVIYIYIYNIVYLYNTYAEHRCSFSTGPTRCERSVILSHPNGPRPTHLSSVGKKETALHLRNFGPHYRLHREKRKPHAFDPHSTLLLIQPPLTQPRTPSSLPCFIHKYGHADGSPCHHRFPNHSGYPNGSTRQMGSSARVCGTLDWILAPMRSVWTTIGAHKTMISYTNMLSKCINNRVFTMSTNLVPRF
jgi:hypothetical protein